MKPVHHGVDIIAGEHTSIVEYEASIGLTASFEARFDNLEGELFLAAAVGLIAEASSSAVGLQLMAPVFTGNGADLIIGSATASTTVSAMASVAITGLIEAINNSEITSTVVATAFARAVASATAIGIDSSGFTATGNGNDLIVGEATANGIAEAVANASADVLTHSDGTGLIDSSVFTDLLSTTDIRATAIGIRGGVYDLGKGDDRIIARAAGVGVNIGVQDVLINGGKGRDIFDLQSGSGAVIGGKDQDLLILEGSKADYTFIELEVSLGVNILNRSNNTNLLVSEVEKFKFAADGDLIHPYADLTFA